MKSIAQIPNWTGLTVRQAGNLPAPYICVVGLVMLAALLRYALGLVAPNALTFAAFYPVITLSALLWGLGPSVFAVGFSAVVAWYAFLPPQGSFAIRDLDTAISLFLFVSSGGLIAYIGEAYHQALRKLVQAEANRRKEEEKRSLLLREMAHRSRNTFAVAQAIVTRSLRNDPAIAETINQRFATLFQGSNGDA